MRWLKHLIRPLGAGRAFPTETLAAIHAAVAKGEGRHFGEIVFAVEAALPLSIVLRAVQSRDRAHLVFSQLRVWDTADNTGVLIYVLLADRAIEIVADRGIAARVAQAEWDAICAAMRAQFVAGEFERGAVEGVDAVNALLTRHFPSDGKTNPNELPDAPVLL
jgi:uncharacterized membrane protein